MSRLFPISVTIMLPSAFLGLLGMALDSTYASYGRYRPEIITWLFGIAGIGLLVGAALMVVVLIWVTWRQWRLS